jgi:hypothetical protein
LRHDLKNGRHVLFWDHDPNRGVRRRLADGLEFETHGSDSYSIVDGMPLSARARTKWTLHLARGDWRVRIEVRGVLSSDAATFRATNSLVAHEHDAQVFAQSWSFRVPRKQA